MALTLPTPGASTDTWGTTLNATLTGLDTDVQAAKGIANSAAANASEALTQAGGAASAAASASTAAGNAQTTANTANSAASTAQSSANGAATNASSALSAATTAATNAAAALAGTTNIPVSALLGGFVMYAIKSGGSWPARPTARGDILVLWLDDGTGAPPASVTSGTGGMRQGLDLRLLIVAA